MKRLTLSLLLWAALAPAHAQTIFRESEPNNNMPQAQFLNTSDSEIIVFGDRTNNNRSSDWYRVWGNQGGIFDLMVSAPSAPVGTNDPIVGLFDHTGRELAFGQVLLSNPALGATISNYRIMTSGYYYVAVSARGDRDFRGGGAGGRGSTWAYTLSVGRTSVPEPSEWAMVGLSVLSVGGLMLRARYRAKNP